MNENKNTENKNENKNNRPPRNPGSKNHFLILSIDNSSRCCYNVFGLMYMIRQCKHIILRFCDRNKSFKNKDTV